jgi:hypothetical protein
MAGAGYDARFDRKLSVTPELTVLYSDIGTTYLFAMPQRRGVQALVVALSIGFTWH